MIYLVVIILYQAFSTSLCVCLFCKQEQLKETTQQMKTSSTDGIR